MRRRKSLTIVHVSNFPTGVRSTPRPAAAAQTLTRDSDLISSADIILDAVTGAYALMCVRLVSMRVCLALSCCCKACDGAVLWLS